MRIEETGSTKRVKATEDYSFKKISVARPKKLMKFVYTKLSNLIFE